MSSNPKLGVGLILTWEHKILLAKRHNSHGSGHWTTSGGHLEFGETVIDCAIRETMEEAGVQIPPERIQELGFTEDFFATESKHYITCFVTASVDDLNISPQYMEPEKFSTPWQWFDVDALPAPLFIPVTNALHKFHSHLWQEASTHV